MNHCPNCGAHLEPYKVRCEYCGSWYWDLAAFDCDTDKPVYVKFKTNYMGQETIITALTKPSLECVETESETKDMCDNNGAVLHRYVTSRTCDITAKFRCIPGRENTLFQIEIKQGD